MPQPSFSAANGDARQSAVLLDGNIPHAMPPKQAEYELPDVQGCGVLCNMKLRAKSAGTGIGQVLYRTACSDALTVRGFDNASRDSSRQCDFVTSSLMA
jgi:hypothetical protein